MTSTGTHSGFDLSAVPVPDVHDLPTLLARLAILDVRLTADGDALHFDAPDGAVTDDLLALLRQYKGELLGRLAAHAGEPQPESSGPAGFSQQRMHTRYAAADNPAGYNVASRIELVGPLDVDALNRALTALLRRQSVLRTRFATYAGELVQEVMPLVPVRLDVTDLRGLPPHERSRRAREWLEGQATAVFDLSVAPLLRGALLRTGAERWTLALVVHHIAVDGWGLGVLLADLGALYAAALRTPGPEAPSDAEAGLPPLAVSYVEAARQLRAHLSGARLESLRSWWRQALAGAPMTLDLPHDRPHPERPSDDGGLVSLRLDKELTDRLAALARARNTTVFTVLLSAYGTLLCRLSGQSEVVVACNIANRTRREYEPLVGEFANNVALRLGSADTGGADTGADADADAGVVDAGDRIGAAIDAAARTFFAAADHQEYPFSMVVADHADRRPPHGPGFPQAVIVMESQGVPVLDLPGVTAEVHDVPVVGAVSDLCLALTPDADGIELMIIYNRDRLDHATVERWAADYAELLHTYVRVAGPPRG